MIKKLGSLYLFLALAILLSVTLCMNVLCGEKVVSKKDIFSNPAKAANNEPKFIKEGQLIFLSGKTKEIIIQIDIEIADTPHEIATGLMYRRSMPNTAGMLFIYKQSQQLFFWMKNTYIPLDIMIA